MYLTEITYGGSHVLIMFVVGVWRPKLNTKNKEYKSLPKKTNNLIKRILAHSATKIKGNPPPPYSTLNPERSSDSTSAKSKGVRLVSAKQEINQTNDKGRERKINHK
jgi:hypothetical protein